MVARPEPTRQQTLLIVHRLPALRELARMMVEALMPEMRVATAAEFGAATERDPGADLVLLLCVDDHDKILTGAAALPVRGEQTPVAVMATHWTPRAAEQLFRQGVRAIIPLPFAPDHFRAVVQLVMAGGAFRPSDVLDRYAEARAAEDGLALTQRQQEVLELLREGHANKSIALRLGLRETTVKVHVKAILRKLGVSNRTQAALRANPGGARTA